MEDLPDFTSVFGGTGDLPDFASVFSWEDTASPLVQRNRLTGEKRPKPISGALPGLGHVATPEVSTWNALKQARQTTQEDIYAALREVPSTVKSGLSTMAELPGMAARAILQPVVNAAKYASPHGLPPAVADPEVLSGALAEKARSAEPLWDGRNLPGLAGDVAESVNRDYAASQARLEAQTADQPHIAQLGTKGVNQLAAAAVDPLLLGGALLGKAEKAAEYAKAIQAAGAEKMTGRELLDSLGRPPSAPERFAAFLHDKDMSVRDYEALGKAEQQDLAGEYVGWKLNGSSPEAPRLKSPYEDVKLARAFGADGAASSRVSSPLPGLEGPASAEAPLGGVTAGAPPLSDLPARGAPDEAGFLALTSQKSEALKQQEASVLQLKRLGYQVRADFLGQKGVDDYRAALGYQRLREAFPTQEVDDDVLALYHGTPHPLKPGDTLQAVRERLAASGHLPQAELAAQQWREQADRYWQVINEKRAALGMEPLDNVENYVHQTYVSDETPRSKSWQSIKPPPSLNTPITREKTFATARDAALAGRTPVTRFSDLVLGTERAYAHTNALYDLVSQLRDLPALADGRPPIVLAGSAPNRFYREAPPGSLFRDAAKEIPSELPYMGEGDRVFIHQKLDDQLAPLFERDDPNRFDKALSFMKSSYFLGSLFHPVALGEAATQVMGPRGLYEWVVRGGGVPILAQTLEGLGRNKLGQEAIEEAIRAGVTYEIPSADVMSDTFHGILGAAMARGKDPEASLMWKVIGKSADTLHAVSAAQQRALWADLHAPLKITAYHRLLDRTLRFRDGENLALGLGGLFSKRSTLQAMSGDEVRRAVALHVNDAFGGQNWKLLENAVLASPKTLRALRGEGGSPDWNVSALRAGTSFASQDPVRRAMGVNYWIGAIGLWGMYNLVSKATSGHWLTDRGSEHLFDLPTGMTEERYGKESPVYLNVMKHTREPVEMLLGRASYDPSDKNVYGKPIPKALPGMAEEHVPLLRRAFDAALEGGAGALKNAGFFVSRKALPLWQDVAAATPAGSTLSGWPSRYEMQKEGAKEGRKHFIPPTDEMIAASKAAGVPPPERVKVPYTQPTNRDYVTSAAELGLQALGEPFALSKLSPEGALTIWDHLRKHPISAPLKSLIPYPFTYGSAAEAKRRPAPPLPPPKPEDVDFTRFFLENP